jgi:hypothetical protein
MIRVVPGQRLGERPVEDEGALVEVEPSAAEALEIAFVVRHEEERPTVGQHLLDAAVALLSERLVADGQYRRRG